jgi:alkyl sulfatase BDS1-like metallo-beta-lactamase superfamily hydrolase
MSQPKPNFEQMTMKDLREYILAHRDEEDAIHAMAIRLRNQGKTGTVEEFLEHVKEQTQER